MKRREMWDESKDIALGEVLKRLPKDTDPMIKLFEAMRIETAINSEENNLDSPDSPDEMPLFVDIENGYLIEQYTDCFILKDYNCEIINKFSNKEEAIECAKNLPDITPKLKGQSVQNVRLVR